MATEDQYVIRLVDPVGPIVEGEFPTLSPAYLKSFDPSAHDGQGAAVWTDDRASAAGFDTVLDLMKVYWASPACRPRRPDGLPNRPLTAFTIAIE